MGAKKVFLKVSCNLNYLISVSVCVFLYIFAYTLILIYVEIMSSTYILYIISYFS